MKPPRWNNCTEEQLWKYVAWHLSSSGVESVLVGGAVAAIYSRGAYRSGDLDFIVTDKDQTKLEAVLSKLGFRKAGRHYRHPQCRHLFLEFPPGPLAIGFNYRIVPDTHVYRKQPLRLFSPTDCVCDRLASYIHFKSRDSLDQALLVARSKPVDLLKIKRWCRKEHGLEQYAEFISQLEGG